MYEKLFAVCLELMHLLIGQASKNGYKSDLNMGLLRWQLMGQYRLEGICWLQVI